MRKIVVVTGTRAEYGLLKNVIKKINEDSQLKLQLIVTGTHLSKEYGYTIKEIEADGFYIEEKINILMENNKGEGIAKSMALLQMNLAQSFFRLQPDFLLILGDRYEILAAASTAMVMNIPIAHISGGEITEGAVDDQIRHSITKMSHVHFPGAKAYGENIKRMGEEAWRIFEVGDPGIENIKNNKYMTKEELYETLKIKVDRDTLLVTFHPVTLELERLPFQVTSLISALHKINKKTIITYPNSDAGGKFIIEELKKFAKDNKNIYLYESLGLRRYLSVMKECGAVVGNSSSAIVEAPFLKVPAVNIGNRQKGRLMAENIINCGNTENEVIEAIELALSSGFRRKTKKTISLYGEGNTSEEIVRVLKKINIDERLLKKKLIWS